MDWQHILATRTHRMSASEIRELLKLLDQPDIISFAGGIPDPDLFPAQAFSDAMSRALSGSRAGEALQYSVSEGHAPLRDWIVGEMGRLGVPCTRENILITSGSQQALDYLGKLMLSPGDTALLGWPTYLGALGAFNAYEPRYVRFDPDRNQPPEHLAEGAAPGRIKFAYLSVDFANPTGRTLDDAARARLLDTAEALDIAVIEDAAYQSLRYDGEALAPVLAREIDRVGHIDACRTIYCGSFSKTLAPGLRVGWVCAAREVIDRMVLLKQAGDLHSATVNQMAIAEVATVQFDAHVDKIRVVYRQRRDAMLAALETHMPVGVEWTRPDGGMFVWLTLPPQIHTAPLLERSLESERVAFVPGHAFFADGSGENTLRLSFSQTDPATISDGIARLGRLIGAAL